MVSRKSIGKGWVQLNDANTDGDYRVELESVEMEEDQNLVKQVTRSRHRQASAPLAAPAQTAPQLRDQPSDQSSFKGF